MSTTQVGKAVVVAVLGILVMAVELVEAPHKEQEEGAAPMRYPLQRVLCTLAVCNLEMAVL